MTDKPIIFQGHSVLALLSGEKTQTRRVIKPQPIEDIAPEDCTGYTYFDGTRDKDGVHITKWTKYCPGMRLWVKETWGVFDHCNYDGTNMGHEFAICYKADGDDGEAYWKDSGLHNIIELVADERWRNPMFMPRWASRITLEITDVRIQRLHDISEEDAMAEGVLEWRDGRLAGYESDNPMHCGCIASPIECYAAMWEQINGKKYPWESNPWVYALSFSKRR